MAFEEIVAPRPYRTTLASAGGKIIRPQNDRVGRSILTGKDNGDVAFCGDSKLAKVRGNGHAIFGSPPIWAAHIGKNEESAAARSKGAGVRAWTTHKECGMGKLRAEQVFGHPLSQSDSDEWIHQETKRAAKRQGMGYIELGKSDMCDNCDADHSTTSFIRKGVKTRPKSGFVVTSITERPDEAARVAHGVAVSRGATDRTNRIITTSQRDAEYMKQKIHRAVPDARAEVKIIKPRR